MNSLNSKQKIVILSGHFNPISPGHIEMFRKARKIGRLAIIVNNDLQVTKKRGWTFIPENDRIEIVKELVWPFDVFLSEDIEENVSATIEKVVLYYLKTSQESDCTFYFGNGGDRATANERENEVCQKYNITQIFNLGDKTHSSRDYFEDYKEHLIGNRWD